MIKVGECVLDSQGRLASGFWENAIGLLDNNNPRSLVIQTRWGIHTFFLREAIDIAVLDRGFRIVFLKKNLSPNNFFFYPPKYYHVLEMPTGYINKFSLKIGDKISIHD